MASKNIFGSVQSVLNNRNPKDEAVISAFGFKEGQKSAEVFWVALNCVGQDTGAQLVGFVQAIKAASFHQAVINGLRLKKLIAHKNGDEAWSLTDKSIRKLDQLAREDAPAATGEVTSVTAGSTPQVQEGALAAIATARNAGLLDGVSLEDVQLYVKRRLGAINDQIDEIKRERDQQIAALTAEREEFNSFIKKLAGEV